MDFLTSSLLDILHWTRPVWRKKALENTLVRISAQVHLSVQLKLSYNLNKRKRRISVINFGKNLVTFVKHFLTRQFLLCFFFIYLISAQVR